MKFNNVKTLKFVVRKKPKGLTEVQHSDGTTKIIIEVTQDEMISAVAARLKNKQPW